MKKIYCILIFALILVACNKDVMPMNEDPCSPIPCDTTMLMGKLDTLWTAPLPDNIFGIITEDIFYYQDQIILNASTNSYGYVVSFDSNTKSVNWLWKDIDISHFSSAYISSNHDRLVVHNRKKIAQINLSDGTTYKLFEQIEGSTSNPYGHLLGDYYYYSQTQNNQSVTKLVRSQLSNFGTWEDVYDIYAADVNNNAPNIQSYNLWIHPQTNDSIIIFQNRMGFPNRVDVIAYNLNSKEVIWKHENITKNGNSNHQQIFIHDNRAYFGGSLTFYCFDMMNGEILWEYDHPNETTSFMILRTIYAAKENAIIVKAGGGLFSFHPQTGKLNYSTFQAGGSTLMSGSPSYYDGILYYTANSLLYAVRASSGTVLWSERSSGHPFGATTFRGDVAIDPERRVLYATNNNTLFAIKLFKP